MSDKQPMWVHCECQHKWIAAYTPMQMGVLGKILKALRCPMCGGKEIFMLQNPPATA